MSKRGPYKKYLIDEDTPIPKRSRTRYAKDFENGNNSPPHRESSSSGSEILEEESEELNESCDVRGDDSSTSRSQESSIADEQQQGDFEEADSIENLSKNDDEALQDEEFQSNRSDDESSHVRGDDSTTSHSQEGSIADEQQQENDASHSSSSSQQSNCTGSSSSMPPVRMRVNDETLWDNQNKEGDHSNDEQELEENYMNGRHDHNDNEETTGEVYLEERDTEIIFIENQEILEDQAGGTESDQSEPDTEDHQSEVEEIEENAEGAMSDGSADQEGEPLGVISGHQELWNAIRNHQQFTSPIDTEVNNSPSEILLKILALSEQNNLSFKAFSDIVRLVNSIFTLPVLPGTQYLLDKLLLSSTSLKKLFYCKNCTYSFGNIVHETTPDLPCPNCRTMNHFKDLTKATYFVLFPIDSQIELLFMKKEIKESLFDPKDALKRLGNFMTDVYDGKCYKEFATSLPENVTEKILSCVFCTDGSPLFKSSSFSIWPSFFSINELPPLLRMKNLLLGGLWFSNKHPPMDLYLKAVFDYLEPLSLRGFKIKVEGEEWSIRMYTIACCVDSGARGAVQGINSHSGYYSCNWCLTPGKWVDKMVFPAPTESPEARNHEGLVEHARECLANDNLLYVFGVQYASPLLKVPKFDIVKGMVQDFPHNVPFGIARTFLENWLGESKRSFYIGSPTELSVLKARMERLHPCIEVRRAVRPLKDMAFWKAREFENWILFYSLVVLFGVLPPKFWTHWSYLVQAVHLLSRQCVTADDVHTAHKLIQHWVIGVERIYGEKFMSFNVHIFSHLAENVARWGPTWAVSTYAFESAIGDLKNILHAQRGVSHQVFRSLSYKLAKKILTLTCQTERTEVFLDNIKSKPNKMTKYLSLPECVVVGAETDFVASNEENFLINQSVYDIDRDNCVVYSKIIASRCVYTSDIVAQNKKYNNSVALTSSNEIVVIKKFIMDKESETVYVFCVEASCKEILKFPQGVRVLLPNHCLRIIDSVGRRLKLISVKDLSIICVVTQMEDNLYVTPFHNLFNIC